MNNIILILFFLIALAGCQYLPLTGETEEIDFKITKEKVDEKPAKR